MGHKAQTVALSFSMTIYKCTEIFDKVVEDFIKTGVMPEFGIQLTNSDPANTIGSQVMAYYGCTLTGTIPMSILNDEEAMLNYDFNFAYTRVAFLERFTAPAQLGS